MIHRVKHVSCLVAVQTLVAVALCGSLQGQAHQLVRENPRTSGYSQPSIGQNGQAQTPEPSHNPQADEWATDTADGPYDLSDSAEKQQEKAIKSKPNCKCGPDCKCYDELICKAGSCKRNYAVFFTARWCAACRVMYPTVNKMREAGYIVYVLDVDDFPEAAKQANAHSLPTTVIIDKQEEVQRFIGVTRYDELVKHLRTKKDQDATPAPQPEPQPEPKPQPKNDPDYYLI